MDKLYSCYKCKEKKTIDQFWTDKSRSSGISSSCKICKYAMKHSWRIAKKLQRDPSYTPGRPGRKKVAITPEQQLEQRRRWRRKSMQNPSVKLASRLRNRLKNVLLYNMPKNKKNSTRSYYSENVGCKGQELVKWIQDKWYAHPITGESMTWDNYGWGQGKWTIDHKRPIKDYIDAGEDPRKANHFSNLRPMWYEENIAKGAKVDF